MSRRPNAQSSDTHNVEPENDLLINGLSGKVKQLKSLTIDMGDEIRFQNTFLKEMDTDMDSTWAKLSSTMNRVTKIASLPGSKLVLYLIGFTFLVFLLIYIMIRFR